MFRMGFARLILSILSIHVRFPWGAGDGALRGTAGTVPYELTADEWNRLRSQIVTSKGCGGRR